MSKVVINDCYGGFGLSDAAYEKLLEWGVPRVAPDQLRNAGDAISDRELTPVEKREKWFLLGGRYWDRCFRDNRQHPLLIKVVEELGADANGSCAQLKIVEIPDDVEFQIEEYDGNESVHEVHRSWN